VRTVRWTPPARTEFVEAIDWHIQHRPGRQAAFVTEVYLATTRAAENAELGSPHLFGTRRNLLAGFRYSLVYVIRRDEVWVVAVAHQRRRPGYWRKRLKDIH
jgi:toxin ParE1/3/4